MEITMDKFEVEFSTKDNGEKPAKDFILGLDVKMVLSKKRRRHQNRE